SRTCARVAAPNAAAFRARPRWSRHDQNTPRSVARRGRRAWHPAPPAMRPLLSMPAPRRPDAHAPRGPCRPRHWQWIGRTDRTLRVSMAKGSVHGTGGGPWDYIGTGRVFFREDATSRDIRWHVDGRDRCLTRSGCCEKSGHGIPFWSPRPGICPSIERSSEAALKDERTTASAVRVYFGRRHPMRADAGGATRVYVHGLVKWRTVPTRAMRPSARALSFRPPVASTLTCQQRSRGSAGFRREQAIRRAIMVSRH